MPIDSDDPEPMPAGLITVQYCPCGCVGYSSDPEHIRLDKIRKEKGFIDALILPSSECSTCQSDLNQREF